MFENIKWTLELWRLRLFCRKVDLWHAHFRRKYCRNGYHKLMQGYVGHGGTGQRMKYVYFLRCVHCNYIFFAKKEDKKRYLDFKHSTKGNVSAWLQHLSSGKPEHINSSVGVGD